MIPLLFHCFWLLPYLLQMLPGIGVLGLSLWQQPRRVGRRCHSLPPPPAFRSQPKPAWVIRQVVRLKALMPDAGCRLIANTFNRRYARRNISVGKSFVAYVLRRHAYEVVVARREIKHHVPPPVAVNRTWGLDLTGKADVSGSIHAILGLVDHGSRRLLSLCLCPRRTALTLLGHVFLTMGRHGVPLSIRTDNDAVFRCRLFRWGLRLSGVRHQLTTPGCPWQNGRIERVFGTLKAHLDALAVHSGPALASLLDEFGLWYNHVRPHQHLGGATPMEAWLGFDPFRDRPKATCWVSFWDGRLAGYWSRR